MFRSLFFFYNAKSSAENSCNFGLCFGCRFKLSYLYFRHLPSFSTTPFFGHSTVSPSGEGRACTQYSHFGAISTLACFFISVTPVCFGVACIVAYFSLTFNLPKEQDCAKQQRRRGGYGNRHPRVGENSRSHKGVHFAGKYI